MESTSNQKLVTNSNIASRPCKARLGAAQDLLATIVSRQRGAAVYFCLAGCRFVLVTPSRHRHRTAFVCGRLLIAKCSLADHASVLLARIGNGRFARYL